jgi:hypothetical protein
MISSPDLIAPLNFRLWRNAQLPAKRSRGLTPAAVAPPNAINPNRNYFVIALDCRSGLEGQALYSSSPYQCLIFHIIAKGFLKSLTVS